MGRSPSSPISSTHQGSSPLHRVLEVEHLSQARRVLFLGRAVSLVSSTSRSPRRTEASLFSTVLRSGLIEASIASSQDGQLLRGANCAMTGRFNIQPSCPAWKTSVVSSCPRLERQESNASHDESSMKSSRRLSHDVQQKKVSKRIDWNVA